MNELDAGEFTAWLQQINSSADAGVPCGSCTACCRSSYFIHVTPDDEAALAHIPRELLFPAPGQPEGHRLMGFDERGHCPMLIDDRCSIYEHRPQTCRDYDCRIFAATGLSAGGEERRPVNEQVQRWRFRHTDADSELKLLKLREIAAELSTNSGSEQKSDNPTQLALLALKQLHD